MNSSLRKYRFQSNLSKNLFGPVFFSGVTWVAVLCCCLSVVCSQSTTGAQTTAGATMPPSAGAGTTGAVGTQGGAFTQQAVVAAATTAGPVCIRPYVIDRKLEIIALLCEMRRSRQQRFRRKQMRGGRKLFAFPLSEHKICRPKDG